MRTMRRTTLVTTMRTVLSRGQVKQFASGEAPCRESVGSLLTQRRIGAQIIRVMRRASHMHTPDPKVHATCAIVAPSEWLLVKKLPACSRAKMPADTRATAISSPRPALHKVHHEPAGDLLTHGVRCSQDL